MITENKKPLIVLGMHRSGTSLLASWLHCCGLNLGENMLGAGNGNSEGHFEDLDIFSLHESILSYNGKKYLIDDDTPLIFNENIFGKAKQIYNERKNNTCWGWKEPRTCLMMELWDQLIPEYTSLVVFREYTQVVDSIIRRKQKTGKTAVERAAMNAKYHLFRNKAANRILKSWIAYNKNILKHLKTKANENYLVIGESKIPQIDYQLYLHLRQDWNYRKLKYVPFSKVFKPELLKRQTADYNFDYQLLKEAEQIMNELNVYEHTTMVKLLKARNAYDKTHQVRQLKVISFKKTSIVKEVYQ